MPDRCLNLVQHPSQPRPTASEATDKDDGDTRASYRTHLPGYGWGGSKRELPALEFPAAVCTCQYHPTPTGGGDEKNGPENKSVLPVAWRGWQY